MTIEGFELHLSAEPSIEAAEDSLEVVLPALRSYLRLAQRQFPPPRRRHLWRIKQILKRFATLGGDMSGDDSFDDAQRTIAAVAIIERSAPVQEWIPVLDSVAAHMPKWGLPWCFAAQAAIEADDLDRAFEWLAHADRLVAIGSRPLLAGLNRVDVAAIPKGRHDLATKAGWILVRHRPSLTNIARLAWTLYNMNDFEGLDEAVSVAQRFHGSNPDEWASKPHPSLDYWLGTLCYLTNRCAIHFDDYAHDHHSFNTAAIRYFEASIAAGTSERDRKHAPRWLAASVIYALRHHLDRLTDREFEHYVELANRYALPGQKIEVLIARLLRRPPREDPKNFAKTVERALHTYDNLARSIRTEEIAERMRERWVDCLVQIDRIDEAARYTSQPLVVRRAEHAHRKGDDETAVSLLLKALADPTLQSGQRIEYAALTGEYAAVSASIPVSLRNDAAVALAPLVPLLQRECLSAFENRMVSWAKRLLYPLLIASPTLDATTVDIVAQFLRATIRSAEAYEQKDRALWRELGRRELLREASLFPLLFAHFDRMAVLREDLDDDELWDLAHGVRGRFHNITLLRCLRALTRTPYYNAKWPGRAHSLLLRSAPKFEADLLVTLWANQGVNAIPGLIELLGRLRSGMRSDVIHLFGALPAPCFRDTRFLDAMVDVCLNSHAPAAVAAANVLARGLAMAQMTVWHDADAFVTLTHWHAQILQAVVPSADRENIWMQWLEPRYAEFEGLLTEQLRASLEELRYTLADNSADIAYWHASLDRFLRHRLDVPAEDDLHPTEASVARELAKENGSDYRQVIRASIETVTHGVSRMEASQRMARIFVASRRLMAQTIKSQVSTISRPQLHTFKNDLAKYADMGVAVPGPKIVDLRNMLAQVDSFLRLRRTVTPTRHDLRLLVEDAVYRPPFVNKYQFGSATEARFFVFRPSRAVFADVDAELFIEAVHALAHNAWTAVLELGEAGYVSIELSESNGWKTVTVSDNGGGVGKHMLKALNDPEDRNTRTKVGFGARLVALVARIHHGRVRYRFEQGDAGLRAELEIPTESAQER